MEFQGRCKAFVGEGDLVERVQKILISISLNKIESRLSTAPSQYLLFLNRVNMFSVSTYLGVE